MRILHRWIPMPLLAAAIFAEAASAQEFPSLGSVEGRVGVVAPRNADLGFSVSADVGLGYLSTPILRPFVGFNYFTADVDRQEQGVDVGGSFSAIGGRVGLRVDPLGAGRFTPYLAAAVTGHNVSTDVDSDLTANLLDGFYVGGSAGVGLTYALDEGERSAVTAEVRRAFINNIGHWAAEVGFRLTPLGRRAYERPLVLDVDRGRDVIVVDRGADAAEAERLRRERERLEAERLRAEREAAIRAAAEQARTERAAAETVAAVRQTEAVAREAAEREAAEARARAEAAEAEARAAQARAAEAEQRLYGALVDLDRLITNVTAIHETERGLTVVLGQGLFASGQSSLSPRARDEVGRIAAVLAQYPERRIAVEGHTDAVGSEIANQRLSEQRAEAVRAALLAQGVDPTRVEMAGFGESRPTADNATEAGRAQNRRVEIVILGARRPAA